MSHRQSENYSNNENEKIISLKRLPRDSLKISIENVK